MRKALSKPYQLIEILESRRLLAAAAGSVWTPLAALPLARGGARTDLVLAAFKPYALTTASMAGTLGNAPDENVAKYGVGGGAGAVLIQVPRPDGSLQRFRVVESDILTGKTEAKYGSVIKTYAGVGVDDKSASIRLDLTPLGFHAQVLTASGKGAYAVDPYYTTGTSVYASYYAHDASIKSPGRDNDVVTRAAAAVAGKTAARTSGTQLRTYRTAVATTGEYAAYLLSKAPSGTTAAAAALSGVVTSMNRVTGVYETELSIRLTLVGNESTLIYTNASTDPYTNTNSSSLLTQNQSTIDSKIGTANYDIGHVFSTAGGGLAGLGVVGNSTRKAQGETGTSAPVGDAFDIDYVAHEMGHQFGANHTFNTSQDSNRNAGTAVEPGSGSTIMAYAGIESSEDLQPHSDPYFAFISLNEILTYVDGSIPAVGTRTGTGNSIPTVTPGTLAYTVPANTPFTLTSPAATDANGDTVSYSWEEADTGTSKLLSDADNGSGALFRTYNPTTSPSRTFPQLASVLAGQTYTQTATAGRYAERLPTTSRAMKFVLTLRDGKAGGGGTNVLSGTGNGVTTATITPTATVASVAAASTFAVSNFNTATTVAGGSSQTITWNVAGTTANGINTSAVNILMSTDGGLTFGTTLAAATANDGTETVTLPFNTASSNVRFKVAAVGNIYFDINNANLTITNVAAPSATPGVPDLFAATDSGVSSTDDLTFRNNAASSSALLFSVAGTVAGATVGLYADGTLIGSAVATGTTTTVTTNGTAALADGVHAFTARQTESGKTLSPASAALNVTIDTVGPTFSGTPVYSYLTTKPQVTFNFSEALPAAPAFGFTVTKTDAPGSGPVTPTVTASGSSVTLTFPTATDGILANGNYTAAANPGALTDAAGNPVTGTATTSFFVLAGDANHDRTTNFDDFLILQANFGSASSNFSTGDFNYDGKTDFNDFLIEQANFGTTV